MYVRAKFKLTEITSVYWNPSSKKYRFEATYDSSMPEDRRFAKATPNGHLEMTVDNPAAQEQFVIGREYYLDIACVVNEVVHVSNDGERTVIVDRSNGVVK